MTTSDFHITTARVVRLLMTIVFLLLAMTKTYILAELGFKPYEAIVKAAALPGIIKYYGIIALLIEFYLVFGLWNKRHYQAAILLGLCLTVAGALLSLVLLMFKINSDCGCGLLG
ncbi:MAG: hypothetical protein K9M55_04370, partial [Candidatus Marinimicrobia bacterium]|nr:hypothetical protein [Candidatus Neomarinimicrobiota bacterium]